MVQETMGIVHVGADRNVCCELKRWWSRLTRQLCSANKAKNLSCGLQGAYQQELLLWRVQHLLCDNSSPAYHVEVK